MSPHVLFRHSSKLAKKMTQSKTTTSTATRGLATEVMPEPIMVEKDTLWRRSRPFFLWPTSEQHCYDAETKILELANVEIKRSLVPISSGYLNTYEMGSHFSDPSYQHLNKTMVMVPGFGAAIGLFYKNYEAFAQVAGLKVFAVDWLGTGRSSRVPFNIRPGKEGSIEAAENFFIDSLEEWREKKGIDKMILFGHSLGGYFSACYAMKYPEHVEHLFLVSPAGVPGAPVLTPEEKKIAQKESSVLYNTVRYFWERAYTPQGLIRFAGPWGPNLVKFYTDRRFAHIEGEEAEIFREYSYHFNAREGSAEAGLHCVLDVGAWGRNPLINRVQNIQAPTTWLYGSHDWMNPNVGRAASMKMTAPSTLKVIPFADHHLYIDNPVAFNEAVISVIRKVQRNTL